tara:strand:- start:4352 stop:5395 length:1044 start_codon:yes stop_codon:yes gene_type:complete
MNLTEIRPFLLYDFKSETELVQEIEKLSQRFTTERAKLDQYTQSEKSVSAYTCFYALTNFMKLKVCLDKIGLSDLTRFELIDIGAGPGTFTLAALSLNSDQQIAMVETSGLMRDQAQKLITGLFPKSNIRFIDGLNRMPHGEKPRLGLFGHSANEMELEQIKNYISKLELDYVLFIEPGTRDFFEKMVPLREWLMANEFQVQFPCPAQSQCPVQAPDWCHQYVKVTHDPEVERLCQLAKKDRRLLPVTLHFYAKEKSSHCDTTSYVIQRMLSPLKFAQPMVVCTAGNEGKASLRKVEVIYKGLSKSEQKNLQKLLAGDTIKLEPIKSMANGDLRAKWKFKTSPEDVF